MMVVAAVNYLLASPLCFALSFVSGGLSLSWSTLFWGGVQGIAFIGSYYLICASMALRGMAIATAILRLSVVIPVVTSILYWGEIPSGYQVWGLLACLVALPLICSRGASGHVARLGRRGILVLGALFLGIGVAGIASKAFVESDVPDARTTFMGVLYGVAALGALASFGFPAWRKTWVGMWDGIKMGLVNVASILAYLLALEQLDGVVVFPVQAVGGLMVNTLFAAVVWNERFVRLTLVGMGVAAVGLVLVNVK